MWPISAPPTTEPQKSMSSNIDADVAWDERLYLGGSLRQRFLLPTGNPASERVLAKPLGTCSGLPPYHLPDIDFGIEDPDILLKIFRTEMLPNFPFIAISEGTAAETLRHESPSLFTSIIAVSSRNSAQQAIFGKMVMQQLAERIVVNGERNMDLLQSVLVYAAWYVYLNMW